MPSYESYRTTIHQQFEIYIKSNEISDVISNKRKQQSLFLRNVRKAIGWNVKMKINQNEQKFGNHQLILSHSRQSQ